MGRSSIFRNLILLLLVSTNLYAGLSELPNECAIDLKKFCTRIESVEKTMNCLGGIYEKLTLQCKQAVNPCFLDEKNLCGQFTGNRFSCIIAHDRQVSPACTKYLAEICWPERKKFCGGLASKRKVMMNCLKDHLAQLSSSCMGFYNLHTPKEK